MLESKSENASKALTVVFEPGGPDAKVRITPDGRFVAIDVLGALGQADPGRT